MRIANQRDKKQKTKIARILDAIFRGLSRGFALKTAIESLGKFFNFRSSPASTVVGATTAVVATTTSYLGTRWWTDISDDEKIRSLIASNSTCFFRMARYTDAFLRGSARAETVINCLFVVGKLIGYDLETPAGIAGLITLFVATWTSYNRVVSRSRYAQELLSHTERHDAESSPVSYGTGTYSFQSP